MFFSDARRALKETESDAQQIATQSGARARVLSTDHAMTFFGSIGHSFRLIREEKEILLFALMQWVCIIVGYLLWTQMLDWIPDELWHAVDKNLDKKGREDSFQLVNLILLAWSFFIVAIVSYPLSLFNAAMISAHYLRASGQPSTIARCMELSVKHLGKLWVFTTIDAWVTVNAILDRLPKKRGPRRSLADEALYYAWKTGTVGVAPALVAGKGFYGAAMDSIALLRKEPWQAIGLRMGYSLVCWVIGILSYIGAVYYFVAFGSGIDKEQANFLYQFYFMMAVPLVIAVGVTAVLVRPFFLLGVAKLYTDVLPLEREVTQSTDDSIFNWLFVLFCGMLSVLLVLYFFGDALGARAWVESLAAQDLAHYRSK